MEDLEPSEVPGPPDPQSAPALPFPVVGIGASAGGLEALQDLFSGLRRDVAMAFFVIQHLSPDFKSMMLDILSRHTSLEVLLPEDGMSVAPGQVYLIPPTKDIKLVGTSIRLLERSTGGGVHHPIDLFLDSLAAAQGDLAVAVVLSGTGTDGSAGVRAVHSAGGRVIVQDPSTARFDGMPRSAVATGVADMVMSSFAIAEHLNEYTADAAPVPANVDAHPLKQIFGMVAQQTRVDLSVYKEGTLVRRIQRRMQATESESMDVYAQLVESDEMELQALSSDLLIGVTEFFRDTEAWAWLRSHVLPEIVTQWPGEIRMWVTGCSTGAEAYTLAMLTMEVMSEMGVEEPLRVFATDANPDSIRVAMAGTYDPEGIKGVPPELRDKYFTNVGEVWQVRRFLRDRITFAVHNAITDPPFTRLALVTCRNMLIYLRPEAQRPVLARMHFGLHEGGVLMLGTSETVGNRKGYFEVLNLKWKIFRARGSSSELGTLFGSGLHLQPPTPIALRRPGGPKGHMKAAAEFYVPPGVAVDATFDIEHFFGNVSPYLKLPEGHANLNLLNMLPPAVSVFVSSAARRVRANEEPGVVAGVSLGEQLIDIRILLAQRKTVDHSEPGLLVFFEAHELDDGEGHDHALDVTLSDASKERISRLEDELLVTRENLRTAVEDLEAANEELQATNEELIASNEELQSTNEELQSVNEELFSVNSEYQEKIEELEYLATDLENLLRSIDVGALFLDGELRVRRFNDTVLRLIPLKAQDLGRHFDDFTMRVDYPELREHILQVLDSGVPRVNTLVDHEDTHWRIHIRPLEELSHDGGVIVTFHDATILRAQQDRIGDLAANEVAVGLAGVGVVVVDPDQRQAKLSDMARSLLGVSAEAGDDFGVIGELLESGLTDVSDDADGLPVDALRRHVRPDGSEVLLRTFAQRVTQASTHQQQILVVLQEVS
ncbi:MAG: PAS domain-containing protein [Myxococcales bacterium]|nr:PAS domain-containing protein [Myxococcales bacterium]